jgi:phosphate:Na+ symporter
MDEPLFDGLGQFLLGLGLFFIGLTMLGGNLKQAGSRRFRTLVNRYARPRWKALLFGLVSGMVMQSSSAMLMILASLATTGMIAVGDALPIIAGFNIGDTLLVFLAVFDIRLAAMYLAGLAGIMLQFRKGEASRQLFGILLGLGLIFFSISEMKQGVRPMQAEPWFDQAMELGRNWPCLSVLIGVGLGFLTQDSTIVAMIAVSLVSAGILGMPQALVIVYGAAIGSNLFKMLLGAAFAGSARQLVRYQNIFNFLGAGLFILLFYAETYLHVPLVMALLARLSGDAHTQVAIAFLLFNLTAAAILTIFHPQVAAWLEQRLPKSAEEELSALKYLSGLPPEEAATELELLRREQLRELEQVAAFFATLREEYRGPALAQRVHALRQLGKEVSHAGQEIMPLRMNKFEMQQLAHHQSRQTIIIELAEAVATAIQVIQDVRLSPGLGDLAGQTQEAMEFLLLSAAEDLESADPETRRMLLGLCADRGPMMDKMRKLYLQPDGGLSLEDRGAVFSLTTGVEKCVWLLRRLVTMSAAETEAGKTT